MARPVRIRRLVLVAIVLVALPGIARAQEARTHGDVVYATVDGKDQSHELAGAYEQRGLDVQLDVVHGAVHGGDPFCSPERVERVVAFLRRTIGQ